MTLPADANTSVDAVVSLYGRYDWTDRSTTDGQRLLRFLESVVVKRIYDRDPALFHAASPTDRVHADAPRFLLVHGTADNLTPLAQAREFVAALRAETRSVLTYLELPGAHHGFDLIDGSLTATVATAIGVFLNEVYRRARSPSTAVV